MKKLQHTLAKILKMRRLTTIMLLAGISLVVVTAVSASVPARLDPRGTVPNPGTQQQELANITFPAPYNAFEFVVTCGACHGGTVDQQAGHFGNWAGTSMASAARDPIFRANQIGVENAVAKATGESGAGNMCFRCHSPNGWMSGRFDPTLAGDPEGRTMIHSIVLSTDDEGILCEFCHRAIGNVTFKDSNINPNDPVWNMMAGISDWPHAGTAFVDQDGSPTIAVGNPYGDTSLQINDGMTYVGKYSGSVDIFSSDIPMELTPYSGQTYAIYPVGWIGPKNPVPAGETQFNLLGEEYAWATDGSLPIHFEAPIGPPIDPATGYYDYMAQGLSLEHPTVGDRDGLLPSGVPEENKFLTTSEFCGSCHDLTVPVLNHGMPEQRTYTEWKFSDFGDANVTCQSCHMPTQKHEYADDVPASLNVDPTLAGWFPYAKDRADNGGTAFHKFAGANRDLPMMMKELYPEPDLEVIGAPTGNDTTIFPGMLSTRDPMYDRAQRNTEIMLLDAVDVTISQTPTWVNTDVNDPTIGYWELKVTVTNNSGHRIPSGYPDGRRFWVDLQVTDGSGVVYQSGYYDQNSATLMTAPGVAFNRALEPVIDVTGGQSNSVMVYERVTGKCKINGTVKCNPSSSLLNDKILFDNRILPAGFDYAQLREAGVKFWNYGANMVPYEDTDRYPNGQNWDEITYRFDAPYDAILNAKAEVYWQTHTREFMEHLRDQDTSNVRPEGPPDILDPNYPLNPNYLSDVIDLVGVEQQFNVNLNDNWGGIAYAAWLKTGEGAPYLVAVADTQAVLPAVPVNLQVLSVIDPVTGLNDPFTQQITWDAVPGADGYEVWIRLGASDVTADWDRLAIVSAPQTELVNTALNVGKTYAYQVRAFNGAGYGPQSAVLTATTPSTLPLPPEALRFVSNTPTTISMSWFDASDNEDGWIVSRQDVPPTVNFAEIARFPSNTATGGVLFTDGDGNPDVTWAVGYLPPEPGKCYNYVVEAYNAFGTSGWNVNGPIQMCTGSTPSAPSNLTATTGVGTEVVLNWTAATGTVTGYRVERSTDGGLTFLDVFNVPDPLAVSFTDTTSLAGVTYWYQVVAYNTAGDSPPSNLVSITTPGAPPAAPTSLMATAVLSTQVDMVWTDNAINETGFAIERSDDEGLTWTQISLTTANITAFSDLTVQSKWTYMYRVYAFNADGRSADSNVITVVTPGEIPQAPSNLSVGRVTGTTVALNWRDNATNETGYRLEWSLDNINWVVIDLPANTVTYTVTGLSTKTTYYFRVQAFNLDGPSAYSETVTATTKKK